MNMPKTEYEVKLFIIHYLLHILCCWMRSQRNNKTKNKKQKNKKNKNN